MLLGLGSCSALESSLSSRGKKPIVWLCFLAARSRPPHPASGGLTGWWGRASKAGSCRMKAQRSQSRNNNDNHQWWRLNPPGMQGPTPCAPHTPGHSKGSSPFILLQRSHSLPFPAQPFWVPKECSPATGSSTTQVPWEDSAQHDPSQRQDRTPSSLETRAPGFPREAACPHLAWSTFPQSHLGLVTVGPRSIACVNTTLTSRPGWPTD